MLSRFNPSNLLFHSVEEGKESECTIPIPQAMRVDIVVRCPKEVCVYWVDQDGVQTLLSTGKDVRYRSRMEAGGVQIVADTSFWYLCQKSSLFEFVDPVPMKVELVQSQADVLKAMIDERIRQWKHAAAIDRELSDEEVEELVLDIASGDLEFDTPPDEFGLGYEEKLKEFIARQKEKEGDQVDPSPSASSVEDKENMPPAEGANSSST